MSLMALLPGLYVNAHALVDHGPFRVWRPSTPAGSQGRRRELRDRLGVPVFIDDDEVWCLRAPSRDAGARPLEYIPADRRALHRSAIREGLHELASRRGFRSWFGLGGAVHCTPADEPPLLDGPVRVEPLLKLRVVGLGEQSAPAIVVRYETAWRFTAPLSEPELRPVAVGERVVRVAGDGPRSGRVEGFDGDRVVLRAGRRQVALSGADYALVASPALVQQVVPDATRIVSAVYAATHALLPDGRPNQYAVHERQQLASALMARLGDVVAMPGGGSVAIDPAPVQVKVRER